VGGGGESVGVEVLVGTTVAAGGADSTPAHPASSNATIEKPNACCNPFLVSIAFLSSVQINANSRRLRFGLGRDRGDNPLGVAQRLDAVLLPFVAGQVADVAVGVGPVD
jgi:hypothetical protein